MENSKLRLLPFLGIILISCSVFAQRYEYKSVECNNDSTLTFRDLVFEDSCFYQKDWAQIREINFYLSELLSEDEKLKTLLNFLVKKGCIHTSAMYISGLTSEQLPKEIAQFGFLKKIKLANCPNLVDVFSDSLIAFNEMEFSNCPNISMESICLQQFSLERFTISNCSLKKIPSEIRYLTELRCFMVYQYDPRVDIDFVSDDILKLEKMEILILPRIPNSITRERIKKGLPNLIFLDILEN